MTELEGRAALVTGASRGIGKAIALSLGVAGVAVAVNYRARRDDAQAVVDAIRQSGGTAELFQADVSQSDAVAKMVDDATRRLGAIDILVNNAGSAESRTIDEITEAEFDRAIAENLKSAFLCSQAVLPGMRSKKWGRIINLSSIGARIGAGSVSVAYGAAKAGVEGLTRAYALRLAGEGVTVNAIAPGLVDTDMGQPLIESGVVARIPMKRAGTGDEIAEVVLMLVRNGYMTGQTVAVNGGSLFL